MMTRRESDSIGTMDVQRKPTMECRRSVRKIISRSQEDPFTRSLSKTWQESKKQRLTRIWLPMCWMKRKAMPS